MVLDVLAGAAERVPAGPWQTAQYRFLQGGLRLAVHGAKGPVQHVDQIPLDLDSTRAVAVPESQLRRANHGPQRAAVPDDDPTLSVLAGRPGILAVPQGEAQRGVSRFLHDLARQPSVERVDARALRPRPRPGDTCAAATRHPQRMMVVSAHPCLPRAVIAGRIIGETRLFSRGIAVVSGSLFRGRHLRLRQGGQGQAGRPAKSEIALLPSSHQAPRNSVEAKCGWALVAPGHRDPQMTAETTRLVARRGSAPRRAAGARARGRAARLPPQSGSPR